MAVAQTAGKRRRRPSKTVVDLVVLVVAVIVLTTVVRALIAQAFYIPSGSMTPQLQVQDRIVVSRLAYRLHDARRGDIVVFDAPITLAVGTPDRPLVARVLRAALEGVNIVKPTTTEYVKRVVGLPGEQVAARDGNLYVDDRLLIEPYLPEGLRTEDFAPVRVPDGMLFVMGDNRGASFDSRKFGPIAASTVVGRVVVRLWPLGNVSWL